MNELLWYLSRATGMVSVVAFTTTFLLGLLTSGRAAPVGVPGWVRASLHRTLSLVLVVFVAVHVVTAVVESYVDIGWISVLIPFSSAYDTFWVGLGTLVLDLLLVVVVTSLLRTRLSTRSWRLTHLLSYAMWPIALAHGLGAATTDGSVMVVVTVGCGLAGSVAIVWRLTRVAADSRQRQLVAAQGWR